MSQTEVQLIKDAVIVNADVSNSAAIDVSKISGVMPLAGGTFTNDVTFDGATAGRDIVFDRSDNALEFLDNAKLILGSNADCQILHDGTDTFIQNKVGDLKIANNVAGDVGGDITIQAMNGEDSIKCIHDASVELYENGTKVAETTALGWNVEGVTFSNGLDMDDDHKILLGTGDDLEIYHESSSNNSFIKNGTGNLEILCDEFRVRNNSASKAFIQSSNNGEIQLYFNGSKKFETTNTGIKVTGIPEFREDSTTTDFSNLSLPSSSSGLSVQNISATTGNFSCLSVVANNANAVSQSASFIAKSHASGNAPEIHITQRDGNNSQRTNIKVTNPGAVELNYDGTKKFETTNNGISVGSVTIDSTFNNIGLPDAGQVRLGNGEDLRIYHSGGVNYIDANAGNLAIRGTGNDNILFYTANGDVEIYHDGSKKFETQSTGVTITGVCTATSFSGSGANLTDVDAGATGGGSDKIFYENGQTVTTNYTIGDTFGAACNAMAAGPITINSGVTVTVNSGETLTIV
tara:strand:+ start:236 stop:1795 length:1560 start_codon:yes stop_codon:yes gene_type:complete